MHTANSSYKEFKVNLLFSANMVKATQNSYIDFYNSNELEDENKTTQLSSMTTNVKYNPITSRQNMLYRIMRLRFVESRHAVFTCFCITELTNTLNEGKLFKTKRIKLYLVGYNTAL